MIQFSIINCIWSYPSLQISPFFGAGPLKHPSFPAGGERNWSRRPVRHSPAPCVAPSGHRATERRLRGSARRRTSRARPKIAMERVGRSTDGMSQELETAGKNGKNQPLERCRTLPNPQITAIKRYQTQQKHLEFYDIIDYVCFSRWKCAVQLSRMEAAGMLQSILHF